MVIVRMCDEKCYAIDTDDTRLEVSIVLNKKYYDMGYYEDYVLSTSTIYKSVPRKEFYNSPNVYDGKQLVEYDG